MKKSLQRQIRVSFGFVICAAITIFVCTLGCSTSGNRCSEVFLSAVRINNLDGVKRSLFNGVNVNCRDDLGRTPLYLSVVYEYTNLFDYLLENEASPTLGASWKGNDTPLHLACAKGNEYMVKRLIDVGVSPNIVNNMGQTPLHYAAWHEQSRIVELLVGYGANIDAMSRRNETPLIHTPKKIARLEEYKIILKYLIDKGADVNASDNSGNTPLKFAARYADVSAVDLLIQHGADPSDSNGGNTALDFAIRLNRHLIADRLRAALENQDGGVRDSPEWR